MKRGLVWVCRSAVVLCSLTWATSAHASTIVFSSASAKATIGILSSTSMTITLEEQAGVSIHDAADVLTGLVFGLSATPSNVALTSISFAPGGPDGYSCAGGFPCAAKTAAELLAIDDPGGSVFGWGVLGGSGTWQLAAGNGSYKPYGIVNGNFASNLNSSVSGSQHDPYLNDAVTFYLTLSGLTTAPTITSATFLMGTSPAREVGTACINCVTVTDVATPEPTSLVLLGTGLVAAYHRRRARRSNDAS